MPEFDYAAALDPKRSVVIEACAGSGKTWLLVSRILRLLLAGAEPGEILAITFTRKAAQEMQARLVEWLRMLALGTQDDARDFLRQRAVPASEIDALLPRAQGLLERVLTAEPGLTINTFHGWFMQLLQRAPLESGVAGNFGLLDQTAALQEEAWQSFAEDLAGEADSPVAAALQELFRDHGLFNTRKLLLDFVAKRAEWWACTAGQADPVGHVLERLRAELGIDPEQDVLGELWQDDGLTEWHGEYAQLLGKNSPSDQKLAIQLADALSLVEEAQRFSGAWSVFFTQAGTPRARSSSAAQAKRLGLAGEARLLELHRQICFRYDEARARLVAQAAYRFNHIGLTCGAALLDAYQRLKDERQTLDFADVEWRVFQLLSQGDYAEYMQYKLDSRYKHILLDEFQDTNPLQWQAMQSWLGAYGGDANRHTVFLVGDPKQSIYRFRRAEPRLFQIAADALERDFSAVRLEQDTSRRSAPAVIGAVNRVFDAEADFAGFRVHGWHHGELEGAIAVLPLPETGGDAPAADDRLSLRNPLCMPRQEDEDARHEQEAAQLADKIAAMVGSWQVMDEKIGPRPVAYRDIMLLVRSRTWLATYERALRMARIPYLSSRQGGLLDTLECSDLVALLEFLVMPFADLKLAQILRSPVFSCSDEDLMMLAHSDAGTWWGCLKALPEEPLTPTLKLARTLLAAWLEMADRLPVHDLLDRIYFEGEVLARYRQAVPQAMAEAVQANLHAFIELALNMDSGRYPSLARFINEVAALRRAPGQESPDEGLVADGGNAVRILTVHGAKGLEAPIVWLLDANGAQTGEGGYRVLLDWPPEKRAPGHFSLLSCTAELARARERYVEAEAAHARRENLNLLYVAMTRARQALIVSGSENAKSGESWYRRIHASLVDSDFADALSSGAVPAVSPEISATAERAADILPVPPTGRRETARLSPARRHGIMLHSLLEWVKPEQPLARQAERLSSRLGLGEADFAPLWDEVRALLRAPELQRFFDPSRYLSAHNELSYLNADGELRRIDRLVEFTDSVWILDYKTTEAEQADYSSLAATYRPQMMDYRKAMADVFPAKKICCALVFPGPVLIEV